MNRTPPYAFAVDLGGLDRGLAEVAGHEFGPVDLDQLALGEQPDRLVDAGDEAGDGGLAGAGVAGEDQVPGDGGALQAGLGAQPVHPQDRGLAPDLALHRREADQLVELGQPLLDGLLRFGRLGVGLGRGLGRCRLGRGGGRPARDRSAALVTRRSQAREAPRDWARASGRRRRPGRGRRRRNAGRAGPRRAAVRCCWPTAATARRRGSPGPGGRTRAARPRRPRRVGPGVPSAWRRGSWAAAARLAAPRDDGPGSPRAAAAWHTSASAFW